MVLVVTEPDFGTTLALAMIVTAMLFTAGVRLRYFAIVSLAAIPAAFTGSFSIPLTATTACWPS